MKRRNPKSGGETSRNDISLQPQRKKPIHNLISSSSSSSSWSIPPSPSIHSKTLSTSLVNNACLKSRSVISNSSSSSNGNSSIGSIGSIGDGSIGSLGVRGGGSKTLLENPYLTNPPDFLKLASKYPSFEKFVTKIETKGGNKVMEATIDFENAEAKLELTRVLLLEDFGIKWDIPIEHLCPPLPNRINYLHWLNDLLKIKLQTRTKQNHSNIAVGIDIGTGANCIYALLGHRMYSWKFIATEIDEESVHIASKNVQENDLENYIEIIHVKDKNHMLVGVIDEEIHYDFCMCNPPFFSDAQEAYESTKKSLKATSNEMITVGGEVEFVKKIIADSLKLKQKICWYTSMLGKKSSLKELRSYLQKLQTDDSGIQHIYSTEFVQGNMTRWGLAWTFFKLTDQDLSKSLAYSSISDSQEAFALIKISKITSSERGLCSDSSNTINMKTFIKSIEREMKKCGIGLIKKDEMTCTVVGEISEGDGHICSQILQQSPGQYIIELKNGFQQKNKFVKAKNASQGFLRFKSNLVQRLSKTSNGFRIET